MTQEQQEQFFIDNKYLKKYLKIIEESKNRPRPEQYEKHHIIPKSFGGSDSEDNYAYLTLREHFLVHLILVKISKGQYKHKMAHALNRMINSKKGKYKITSRMYETVRIEHSEAMSILMSDKNNPMSGKTHTSETKQKMSEALSDKNHPSYKDGRYVGASKDPKIAAAAAQVTRDNRTPEKKEEDNKKCIDRKKEKRAKMTPEEKERDRIKHRDSVRVSRANRTPAEKEEHLRKARLKDAERSAKKKAERTDWVRGPYKKKKSSMTPEELEEEREEHRRKNRIATDKYRAKKKAEKEKEKGGEGTLDAFFG